MKKLLKSSIAVVTAVTLMFATTPAKSAVASSWVCDELMPWGSNTWVCTLDGQYLYFVDCSSGSCVYMQI